LHSTLNLKSIVVQVLDRNGVYLPDCNLWLDPHSTQSSALVSHAHADHVCRHGEVLCTRPTAAMMRLRGAQGCRFRTLEFGEVHVPQHAEAEVLLVPAGHVLGSAQMLIECNGTRLLYSGDFKMRAGLSAEAIQVPQADILVMETTFGLPRYKFPPREAVMNEIISFCHDALTAGCTPVLFCYSLGKGQEVLAGLHEADFPIYLHTKHWEMANLYRHFDVALPEYHLLDARKEIVPLDGVLLCASGCRKGRWFANLGRVRTAYISGWALDRSACWRFGTDTAFALSDHADYDELWEYVGQSGAHTVYTTHGFDRAFAADLRSAGYHAQPLAQQQMAFAL
jgi:Cft2 family RNA processing exonuclease